MITSLSLHYDLQDTNIGYVIGDHDNIKAGDKIPVYIPKLMSSIEHNDEINSNINAIESSNYIFCNASECRPVVKTRIRTNNYIMAKAMDNSDYSNGLKNRQRVTIFFANDSLRDIYFDVKIDDNIDQETNRPNIEENSILIGGTSK